MNIRLIEQLMKPKNLDWNRILCVYSFFESQHVWYTLLKSSKLLLTTEGISFTFNINMSIVTLFVDTSDEKVSSERRFDKSLTISQLKVKKKKEKEIC